VPQRMSRCSRDVGSDFRHAHDDEAAYRDYRDRYRDMAKTLGFEGHIAWAAAML
jgi:hypothetical protein